MAAKKKQSKKKPTKSKVKPSTEIEKKPQGHNLTGRPKGVKNKTTLFKEAMKEGFEQKLMSE